MVDPIGVSLRLSAAAAEISGLVGLRNPSREPMTTSRPRRPNARAVAMARRHLECRRHKYINEYKTTKCRHDWPTRYAAVQPFIVNGQQEEDTLGRQYYKVDRSEGCSLAQ